MAYFVFQVSDQSAYGKQRTAQEVFNYLVKDRNAWGFGYRTPNRKAIQAGDRVLFYLTGPENQTFVGSALLKTGAYENTDPASKEWYLDPETLRIDLEEVQIFTEPRPRKNFPTLEWRPAQGGSSKISEKDYFLIVGGQTLTPAQNIAMEDEMEFALEKYLEDFIVDNWDKIDFGETLKLYEDENGNTGQQYYTGDAGYIDILATDERGDFVVIELKKGRKNDEVVGQILRYIGWVRRNLTQGNKQVRGIIIVGERDSKLELALEEMSGKVVAKVYRISFKLDKY